VKAQQHTFSKILKRDFTQNLDQNMLKMRISHEIAAVSGVLLPEPLLAGGC